MRKTRRSPPSASSGGTGTSGSQAIISTPKTLPEGQAHSVLAEEISAAELQQRYGAQIQHPADADQLYQELLVAGSRFRNRVYANKYTVNVLTLYVDNAVEQVKSLLVQEEYRSHLHNLYILRKQTRPTALFVFYGIYDTLEQALEASNSLPAFLHRYNPYPLSIHNALARATN
jgi:predicted acylesterase/phospholipase RssA